MLLLLLTGCAAQTPDVQDQMQPASEETAAETTQAQEETLPQAATTIPGLYFEGDISGMKKKSDVRKISVQYSDENETVSAYATLKVQGTSSLKYDKKNYTIQFYQDEACEEKKLIDFGWGEQNKYCLKANWIDKTHARNIVSARLAAEVQEKYGVLNGLPNHGLIDGFPIEIYINGEFLGLYTLNIPKDAWMFNMDEANENHLVFCGEDWELPATFEAPPDFKSWSLEVGTESEENLQKLDRMVKFVMESTDEEFREHIGEYLDLDATLNYIILSEFARMSDNLGKNMLLVTYDGLVWYPSLYDLDTTWGTHWTGLREYNRAVIPIVDRSKLLSRVKEVFGEEMVQRYFELREDILTKEHVMELFYDFRKDIPEATWTRENERWENIPGFDYSQIEQFLDVHIPLMDFFMQEEARVIESKKLLG